MDKVAQLKLDVAYCNVEELEKIYNALCIYVGAGSNLGKAKTVGDFYEPEDKTNDYKDTLETLKKEKQCTCILDSQEHFRKSSVCPVHI